MLELGLGSRFLPSTLVVLPSHSRLPSACSVLKLCLTASTSGAFPVSCLCFCWACRLRSLSTSPWCQFPWPDQAQCLLRPWRAGPVALDSLCLIAGRCPSSFNPGLMGPSRRVAGIAGRGNTCLSPSGVEKVVFLRNKSQPKYHPPGCSQRPQWMLYSHWSVGQAKQPIRGAWLGQGRP
jgi:hypothetical protein